MSGWCAILTASVLIALSDGLRYNGCYINPAGTSLINMPLLYGKQLSQTLIPQLCHDHCLKYNMPWAALQGGDRCWCSNALQPETKVDDKECNQKCAGDSSLACGSAERLTVYEVDEITNSVGCFKDFIENRTMPLQRMNQELAMNPNICIGHCRNKRTLFAGIEVGTECWCSTKQPPENTRAENFEECNFECSGDASRICGGHWRLSVFTVDDRANYVGCYETENPVFPSSSDNLLSFPGKLTPSICIGSCRERRKSVAGLTGQDCWCMDKLPSYTRLSNETDCNLQCDGDNSKECGGFSRMTVYELQDIAPYIGCYKDGGTPSTRQLPYDIAYWQVDLTPELCIIHCRNRQRSFAGMHLGKQCFCGDKLPLSRAPEVQCSSDCPGDPSRKCGGDWRLSVYNLQVREDISEFYMGCYIETSEENNKWEIRWNFPKHLTPELCLGHCWRNKFAYAAVRDGDECRCANDIVVSTRSSESECSLSCPGDRNAKCGHLFRTNVYQTRREEKPKGKMNENYLGCFELSGMEATTISRPFIDSLTDEKCIQFCMNQGFQLAGLQNGVNCTCLDVVKRSDKVEDGKCSKSCSGDKEIKCGGVDVISIFKTGLIDINDDADKKIGCYTAIAENGMHLLPDTNVQLIQNSPQRCISLCFYLGYKFSGVESRTECHCGNEKPGAWLALSEYDCWEYQCPGDRAKDCGGKKRILVHFTGLDDEQVGVALSITRKPECVRSVTTVNGVQPCRSEVIFEQDFKRNSDLNRWTRQNYMPTDFDHEFMMFTDKPENCYFRNGILFIKPILLSDEKIRGRVTLDGCTGRVDTLECDREAFAFRINPPIASARLILKQSFKYGRIDITAKLPSGDWIWPELRLGPADKNQTDYIKLAFTRGNARLLKDHIDIGNTLLEAGIAAASPEGTKQKTVIWTQSRPWSSDPHTYSTIWSPTKLSYLIDNKRVQTIHLDSEEFKKDSKNFVDVNFLNEELYLTIGVSVGGVTEFPDGIVGNTRKPWQNFRLKALSQFYQERNAWYKTWSNEDSSLNIYSITVTAL